MGVNTTGAIYKGFIFNGIDSKDYGVYITGEGVYNAPERDVEIITIPARNGAFVRDNGRFENIVVSYPAGMFGDQQTDFAEGISDLRNALAATKGYCRLTDEYNPDEYREAVYKGGLEVSPEQMGRAGQFNISFECKPQRFLTSGETFKNVIPALGPFNNPTLFPARPLLYVEGYGDITINGQTISVISTNLGDILLSHGRYLTAPRGTSATFTITPTTALLNTGDAVNVKGGKLKMTTNAGVSTLSNFTTSGGIIESADGVHTNAISFNFYDFTFQKGTAKTGSASVVASIFDGTQITVNVSVSISLAGVITITATTSGTVYGFSFYYSGIWGNSSQSALGDIYIDLDIGEAYKEENNELVSVNDAVYLGAELPELVAGNNYITYDNTITLLKVKPRWWRV